jgi:hypothetical protein
MWQERAFHLRTELSAFFGVEQVSEVHELRLIGALFFFAVAQQSRRSPRATSTARAASLCSCSAISLSLPRFS